jgi:hypothetical protein
LRRKKERKDKKTMATHTPAGADLLALARPTVVDDSGARPPANSEIRKIAQDVAGALKYSFAAVAANPNANVRPDSVEAAFKQALQSLPEKKREQYQKTAAELVKASVGVRTAMFGRAAQRGAEEHIGAAGGFERYQDGLTPLAIDRSLLGVRVPTLTVPLGVARATADGLLIPGAALPGGFESFESDFEDAISNAQKSKVMNDSRLEEIWGPIHRHDGLGESGAPDDFEELAVTDKMGFWITQVKCIDETNPEWGGDDEIALAAVKVDETGDTTTVPEIYIGGGFDDGAARSYPSWRYTYFSMREGTLWPKTYAMTLLLAEKDHGGLSAALGDVWSRVRDRVREAIRNAVATALAEYLGPAIARAIGEAVAWVVNALVGWIIDAFRDDIFPPFVARVTTPSMSARWNYPNGTWGNPQSGIRTASFYGHGGHYQVQYYWKFFA